MTGRLRATIAAKLAGLLAVSWLGLNVPGESALAHVHRHHHGHASRRHTARSSRHRAVHPSRHWRSSNHFPVVHWTWDNGSPTDPTKDAELVLDGRTGRVLYARNANAQRYPASLTKMMTLYLLFGTLERGQLTLNSSIYVSSHAASQSPTKLGLPAGDRLPLDVAIRSIVVLSANDMAVAVAEALGGTESHFAQMMTEEARELGMRNTFYHNASGLPDNRQITTASDLGLLARHLAYDFPQYFHYFSLEGFSYRGRYYKGHDHLLGLYAGADGIKTGYTNASGFNLVTSVVRNGANIIGIVMGGRSAHRRDMEMVRLLDWTFGQIAARPQLVARAQVPWERLAREDAQPIVAGFQFRRLRAPSPPRQRPYAAMGPNGEMDEDTAESQSDDEIAKIVMNTPPQPRVGLPRAAQLQATATAEAPKTRALSRRAVRSRVKTAMISAPAEAKFPAVKPLPSPLGVAPIKVPAVVPAPRSGGQMAVAAYLPQDPPAVTPIPRHKAADKIELSSFTSADKAKFEWESGSPKISQLEAMSSNRHGWTVQIGAAFADMTSAKAELKAYAHKSVAALGQAVRIVVPFQSSNGKTMYRARFGLFAERQARSICATLTHRGHSCFATALAH